MKLAQPFVFFLNSIVDFARLRQTLPTDFQLRHSIDETKEVLVLDTFDHALRLSNRLLLQHHGTVRLLDLHNPSILVQPCPADWRFLADLAEGPIKDRLRNESPLRAFFKACSGFLRIGRLMLLDNEEKTHVRAHVYIFDRGNQTLTLGDTQPLQGYAKSHRLLSDAFREQGAQTCNTLNDLYLLLGADSHMYCSKPGLVLNPNAPVRETACRIISTYIQVARENETGVNADYDTEFLHDYRVSLRKVRAILSLFTGVYTDAITAQLKRMFAEIMKQTNRLRDLDVYLLEESLYFSMVPDSMHEGLNVMFEVFVEERQQQLKRVIDMLNSDAYRQTISDLARQFSKPDILESGVKSDEPTLPFARQLIWKRYNKVCKIARRINDTTPDEQIHVLRIQCKKLRYLMEFFTPLFSKKTIKKLITALKRLQDNLGRFNDFSVQQRSLQTFLQEHSHHQNSMKLAESIGALIAVLHQRQLTERQQIMKNFARFDGPKTRNAFQTLFDREDDE